MADITRGDIVRFTANFTDENSLPVIPASANLYVNYVISDGTRTTATVTMSLQTTDSDWTADWESDVASPGIVYWSARAVGPHAAEDGNFELLANPANPSS